MYKIIQQENFRESINHKISTQTNKQKKLYITNPKTIIIFSYPKTSSVDSSAPQASWIYPQSSQLSSSKTHSWSISSLAAAPKNPFTTILPILTYRTTQHIFMIFLQGIDFRFQLSNIPQRSVSSNPSYSLYCSHMSYLSVEILLG